MVDYLKTEQEVQQSMNTEDERLREFYKSEALKNILKKAPYDVTSRQIILPKHLEHQYDIEARLRTTETQRQAISRLFNFDRTDISSEAKFRMIIWMRENTVIICPFCSKASRPCLRIRHPGFGVALCREESCGQAFNAWEATILDKRGREISEEDPPEELKRILTI